MDTLNKLDIMDSDSTASPSDLAKSEASSSLIEAIEVYKEEMTNQDATSKERQLAADKILELSGVVTHKDKVNFSGGVASGLQISKEVFSGVFKTLGDVFGVKELEDVSIPREVKEVNVIKREEVAIDSSQKPIEATQAPQEEIMDSNIDSANKIDYRDL